MTIVTSAITLLEVLVAPYRSAQLALAERYEALLMRSRGLTLVNVDLLQLRTAAALRARHKIKAPDALQLAAAITTRCSTFVTNDRALPSLPGLRIIQLDEVVRAGRWV